MKRADYLALIDSYGGKFTLRDFEVQSSIENMDPAFIRSFLAWRLWTGLPTMISSAWRKSDPKSHGVGMAIDCLLFTRWKTEQASPIRHWLQGTTWPFMGVGLYFDWSYFSRTQNRRIPAIGLHLDDWDGDKPGQRPLRWLRIGGQYYYQSLSTGLFYCRKNQKTISLEAAIDQYNKSDGRTAA